MHRPKLLARTIGLLPQLTRPDRATAILEQGLLAAVRMVAFLVFARIMPTELFGAFALVVSISFILNQVQRSVVILPFIIACQKADEVTRAIRQWWWIDVISMAVTAALLLAAWGGSIALRAPEWVQTSLLFSAVGAPPLMLYTFHRRMNYQIGDHRSVLVMVSIHILCYAFGILSAYFIRDIETLPFLAFAFAPAVAALVGTMHMVRTVGVRPPSGLMQTFRGSIELTKWSFLSCIVGSAYTNGMNIIVAGLVGPVGSASFAATRTIVAPTVSLTVATDMIDKPRAGRALAADGVPGLRRSVRNTLVTLLVLGGPYLLIVSTFSGSILELVYGRKYAGLETELRLWAFAMLLHMVTNPLNTHLTMLRDTKSIFLCSLAGALVALAVAVPLLGHFGIIVALLGISCGRFVNVMLLYNVTRRGRARTSVALPKDTSAVARPAD